jgi:hypothetical protein
MPLNPAEHPVGLEALREVTPGMMAAVDHDITCDPKAPVRILHALTEINTIVPLGILGNAEREGTIEGGSASSYAKGALYILGLMDRPQIVSILESMLSATTTDDITEDLPAA